MDWILLGFLAFFCGVGIYKGFVKAIFSLISTFLIAYIAFKLCPSVSEGLAKMFGDTINSALNSILNNVFPGSFSDISQLQDQISQENIIFALFLNKILQNITFEGELTAGQILSPTLSNLLLRVLAFMIVFVVLLILIKLLRIITDKIVNFCGFSGVNRLLGGVVGLVKGLLYFSIFYLLFCAFANITVNENLLNFVSNGEISKNLYETFTKKIINLFY